jgi:hypothetical protein
LAQVEEFGETYEPMQEELHFDDHYSGPTGPEWEVPEHKYPEDFGSYKEHRWMHDLRRTFATFDAQSAQVYAESTFASAEQKKHANLLIQKAQFLNAEFEAAEAADAASSSAAALVADTASSAGSSQSTSMMAGNGSILWHKILINSETIRDLNLNLL